MTFSRSGSLWRMSRFTELKASGTDRVGFPTPRSGVMEAMLAGANRRRLPWGKPMSSETHSFTSKSQSAEPQDRPSSAQRSSMTPSNVILLAAVGVVTGVAAILNFSPFGSLGRYQFSMTTNGSSIIRMDTTTGELSVCYGFNTRKPICLPWGHDDRRFAEPAQPSVPRRDQQ